jgi:hypothetical protein
MTRMLDDYVDVATRIGQFYEQYPQGSLQAEVFDLNDTRVVMRAYAYRDKDDPRPAIAHSVLAIPGTTNFTRGSEIENAETSAIGRAIAFLGFEVKKGIASREEVQNKQNDPAETPARPPSRAGDPASWDGKVTTTATADGSVRKDRDRGEFAAFKLELEQPEQGFRSAQVRFWGDLAHALATAILSNGMPDVATVWGETEVAHFTDKATKRQVNYLVINATRVMTPEWTMPAAEPEAPAAAEPNDLDDLPW